MMPYSERKKLEARDPQERGRLLLYLLIMTVLLSFFHLLMSSHQRSVSQAYDRGYDNGFKAGRISYHDDMLSETGEKDNATD